jgi:nicotinamidase-related amidase
VPVVGWVVDVQRDFMDPPEAGGRLYVHDLFDVSDRGAVLALPAIERAVGWLKAHADALVYTGDWHAPGDREIDAVAPDAARGTYPPHCMGLSRDAAERRGAEIVPSVAPDADATVVLGRDATEGEARGAAAAAIEGQPVFIHKREFSVFEGNPGAGAFVEALAAGLARRAGAAPLFVVCGVAADVCVRQAVDGLLARGQRVAVVRDATWGLGLERVEVLLAGWEAAGGRVVASEGLDALVGG